MTGMSLVEFLQARLDEEAALAERLAQRYIYPPDHDLAGQSYWPSPMVRAALQTKGDEDAAALIGAFSPARVLAEVEAKRRLMEGHDGPSIGICQCNADCPCPTLRLLALPYADHASYRDEWKP